MEFRELKLPRFPIRGLCVLAPVVLNPENMLAATNTVSETIARTLEDRIRGRSARVGIIGLGYVGLPLAVEFAKAGFQVTGLEVSEAKAARVNLGDSYIGDVSSA